MDVSVTPYAPSPGSVVAGNLYADLQSRTLWLGVNPAVDASGAVLIADILGLQDQMDDVTAEAHAYTDTQILTRAPTVHTHPAAQITDFTSAVTGVVAAIPGFNWIRGMIMMYSGSLAEIGVGNLAGWALCDGSNGTPDLRDRFVIGAGNKPVGNKNTPANFLTDLQGAHAHTNDPTTLTLAQIPSHSHTVSASGSFSGTTGSNNTDHSHAAYSGAFVVTGSAGGGYQGRAHSGGDGGLLYAPSVSTGTMSAYHQHAFSGSVAVDGTAAAAGSGGSHTHAMQSAGSHQHTILATAVREAVAYYALALIMKL